MAARSSDRSRRSFIAGWPAAAIAMVTLGLLPKWKARAPILVGLGAVDLGLHWPW
ncbi:hypothetical protein [Micromonospora sp. CB01531]|uniref:hypothetical protein n=1 Tax=Micromonospora sp. CB01531 TaxID=1718947 RepID=UPI000A7693E6|nr:hypothetical protein [Micromonospora sp. CB01531]